MRDQIGMWKGIKRLSAMLACGTVLALAAGQTTQAAPATVAPGALSVGTDLTYPPFAYLKDGVPSGFDVELMQALAKQMGLEPKFVDTRFASLITGMRASHFDVIASALYVTPERQKILTFIPYLKAGSSLLVLKYASYRPASEQELCGKTVGSMQGASWLPKLGKLSEEYCVPKGLGAIETREFDTDAQVTQALKSRAVDVEFMDNVVAAELLRKFPGDYEVSSRELIYPVLIGIAMSPDSKDLHDAIATAFQELRKDGRYAALTTAYGMQPLSEAEIDTAAADAQ